MFTAVENEIAEHGGPYAFGDLSLADLALVPTIVRLEAHDPDFGDFPLTQAWFEAVLAREFVQEWLDDARQLPHIWFDDYLPDPGQG